MGKEGFRGEEKTLEFGGSEVTGDYKSSGKANRAGHYRRRIENQRCELPFEMVGQAGAMS